MVADRVSKDRNWLAGPCAFRLSSSRGVAKCCVCELPFRLLCRAHTCEFCGQLCHDAAGCSRKIWLARELLRRRICRQCDRYRRLSSGLRRGAEFLLYDKSHERVVILCVIEDTGSLFIIDKDTGQRLHTVGLAQLEGVRRGFSLGGRLSTTHYDPLRSLSLTVCHGNRDLTSYNLTAPSAMTCQMWVDGLLAAVYVQRRMEEQELARQWYVSRGRAIHAIGSRFLHNYLPSPRELMALHRDRQQQGKTSLASFVSADSGVDMGEGSLENLGLVESYIEIEMTADGQEFTSREIPPSVLFGKTVIESSFFSCVPSLSGPPSSLPTSSSHLPDPNPSVSKVRSPLASSTHSLCGHHAHQAECVVSRSAGKSPRNSPDKCGYHSRGCCQLMDIS